MIRNALLATASLLLAAALVACDENSTRSSSKAASQPTAADTEPTPGSQTQQARVIRVIDGDTIEVDRVLDGRATVRYIGVDTPETVDPNRPAGCFGREASERNKQLVEGKTVHLEKDVSETDRFGRLLRYVYLENGDMVNEVLVRDGFAQVSTFPPDVKYQQRFLDAQKQARDANRGLWGACQTAPAPTSTSRPAVQQAPPTTAPPPASGCPQGCASPPTGCVIKGNISQPSGEKIYHVPGGGSYNATQINPSVGERWFCTEQEALNNGWRKARN